MSLLDNASLVLTPNAYKEGKLYSVIPSNGNGDFTATRATTATRVNADGLVDLVPYNLAFYSEQFDNAYWGKTRADVTANTTISPSGIQDADTITANATGFGTSVAFFGGGGVSVTSGVRYTVSVYAKKGNQDWLIFNINNLASTTASRQWFNISTGVIGSTNTVGGGLSAQNATIISVGDGWYRCSFDVLANDTGLRGGYTLTNADASFSATLGDTIFLWGAQLVEGTSARDYLRTETRLNIPRVDYSLGGCPNILLEPQRTNLALQSSSFDSATWSKTASSVTSNTTTSPSGIQDADTLTADGTSSRHDAFFAPSVTSGTTYTYSLYAKKGTNDFFQISTGGGFGSNAFANFDLNTGVVGTIGSAATATIIALENGWYRCTMTAPATTTGTTGIYNLIVTSATASRLEVNTLSTYVFLWGAQFEQGAYATSYIPTTTASVTRNQDVITRNNIYTNGLITAAGGTWFVEVRNNRVIPRDTFSEGIRIINVATGSNNGFEIRNAGGVERLSIIKRLGGVQTALMITTTEIVKIAIKWNGTTADLFVNGVKVVAATAFAFTALDTVSGNGTDVPKYINEMILYPTPLTDAQMSMLTSDIYPTAAAAYASLGLVSESPSCLTSTTTF